jgi:hypothetical protein
MQIVAMQNRPNRLEQNVLAGVSGGCKTYRKPKQRPKVTIAIGLISGSQHGANFLRPTIFLASDSQTTRGATKSLDTQKISIVSFPEYEILIAQAGSAELADKTIEVLRGKANGTRVENMETILRTIQDSIREIRSHLTSINQDCGFSADDWKRFFIEDNYFQLLVAFYYDRKPHLYTVDINWCLAIPAKSNYCAIGIGKDMGEFLIREHLLADPDLALAFSISVSVIEKTIDNVDGCGRPVWVGMSFPMPESMIASYKHTDRPYEKSMASLVNREVIDLMGPELKDLESKSATRRIDELRQIHESVSKKHYETIMQQADEQFRKQNTTNIKKP